MEIISPTDEARRFIDEWHSDSPFVTAHTSGSTGKPKEIHLLKSDMRESALATCRFFSLSADSLLVSPLSADYIAGKMMIVRAIVAGCDLIMEQPSNRPFSSAPCGRTADLVPIVPSQLPGLLQSEWDIRNVIIGGAPLSPQQEATLTDAPFRSFATYGMTETCSHVALRPLACGCDVYTALPGISFGTDSDSCLRIDAPRFSFGSLLTNDIVTLIDSRRFIWRGRRDNVIITGGLKVLPEEVESRCRHLIPFPFYVIGIPDPKWGQHIELFIESERQIDTAALAASMRELLPPHQLPRAIHTVPRFSRTDSGKIRRLNLKTSCDPGDNNQ